MHLPASLTMIDTAGDNAPGRRGHVYIRQVDAEGLGVASVTVRANWRANHVKSWTHAGVPHRAWPTYASLRDALFQVSQTFVDSELAKYPRLVSQRDLDADGLSGRGCCLCGAAPKVRAFIAVNWRMEDWKYAQLCADHAGLLATQAGMAQAVAAAARPAPNPTPDETPT